MKSFIGIILCIGIVTLFSMLCIDVFHIITR